MTEHTTTPDDDPAELEQGGELVQFPTPAAPDDETTDDDTGQGSGTDEDQADEEDQAAKPAADAGTDPDEDADGAAVVRVDPPPVPASVLGPVWERESDRRPVLPAWVTDPVTRKAALGWAYDHTVHTAQFHAVRVPLYGARLVARSPRGLARTIAAVLRWAIDADSATLRRDSNWRGEPRDYLALTRQRKETVQTRMATLAMLGLLLAVAAVLLLFVAPGWLLFLAVAGTVGLLGHAGRRQDRPLIGPAVVTQDAPRLTADVVVRALGSLGLAGINKAVSKGGQGITFPAPITREGPGWRADVDLPYGVTVADILARRDRVASGLRRPIGCVWPEPASEAHAGRLVLWVGDRELAKTPPTPWPLANTGSTDLFGPIPFGTDPRGRRVTMTLFEGNVMIGSLPGAGKTASVRIIGLGAALDPTAHLDVFELKGSGDLAALEKVAHTYGSGMDDATIGRCLELLRELAGDVRRRAATLAAQPRDKRPDGKVTRQLANVRRLRLYVRVAIVDECQNLFSHPDYGKEAGELATEIIKLGRALGVVLVLATQRPDKDSLPTGVSSNVGIRYCLRVMDQTANDMILGTSAYQGGLRATEFRPSDKGIGYLVGVADDPVTARGDYIDLPGADRIADRARALRIAAGTLTGHAAGQTDPAAEAGPTAALLDDVLAVVPAGEGKVWSETVVERLAELRPTVYAGWRPEQLAAALKPHGVTTGRQVWGADPGTGKGANRKGIHRADVVTAVTERDRKRKAG